MSILSFQSLDDEKHWETSSLYGENVLLRVVEKRKSQVIAEKTHLVLVKLQVHYRNMSMLA